MSETIKYDWKQADAYGVNNLEIQANDYSTNEVIKQKLISITADSGPLRFHFSMTPAQARQMAMAMIAAAESLA